MIREYCATPGCHEPPHSGHSVCLLHLGDAAEIRDALAAARREGAEAMREACAGVVCPACRQHEPLIDGGHLFRGHLWNRCDAEAIHALPLPGDEPAPETPRFKRICLCGSTRFKRAWIEWNARLTQDENALVYAVALHGHARRTFPAPELKARLDAIHIAKIDASEEVFVLDVGGYIGESTRREIAHAEATGKRVRYLSREFPGWTEADCPNVDAENPQALAKKLKEVGPCVVDGYEVQPVSVAGILAAPLPGDEPGEEKAP